MYNYYNGQRNPNKFLASDNMCDCFYHFGTLTLKDGTPYTVRIQTIYKYLIYADYYDNDSNSWMSKYFEKRDIESFKCHTNMKYPPI